MGFHAVSSGRQGAAARAHARSGARRRRLWSRPGAARGPELQRVPGLPRVQRQDVGKRQPLTPEPVRTAASRPAGLPGRPVFVRDAL